MEIAITAFIFILIIPSWRRYIMKKAMQLDEMYGPRRWAFLYQQDTILRREHLPRMVRRESDELNNALTRGHPTSFNPEKP